MSSYAQLYLHGVEIISWRNEVDPTFLFLFTTEEVRHWLEEASDLNDYAPRERVQFTVSASVLRDRLEVLGIGRTALKVAFDECVKENQDINWSIIRGSAPDTLQPNMELLERITLADWANLLIEAMQSPAKRERGAWQDPTSVESLLDLWEFADPRFLLGAALLACEPDDEIALDVTDLIEGGWEDGEFDPQPVAIEHFGYSLANGNPPVVITEGSTDANFLQAAIQVRYSHLRQYIKFFDFADGAEGSAAAGVRTLKSFAAAGISNRVVLLLDNDTAARDAARAFRGARLPDHYSVLHYPDIELAHSYPTLGRKYSEVL